MGVIHHQPDSIEPTLPRNFAPPPDGVAWMRKFSDDVPPMTDEICAKDVQHGSVYFDTTIWNRVMTAKVYKPYNGAVIKLGTDVHRCFQLRHLDVRLWAALCDVRQE
jgi:hypothetical protein